MLGIPTVVDRLIQQGGNRSILCLNAIALTNRRDTEPYVRWCGRTAGVTSPPTRSPVHLEPRGQIAKARLARCHAVGTDLFVNVISTTSWRSTLL